MTEVQSLPEPKSMIRAKHWSVEAEDNYRFQLAGYRDESEYRHVKRIEAERWPDNGLVKKLQRKDGNWYYYSRAREVADKDLNKVKMYAY